MLGFPFHFVNNNGAMNVVPKNYRWGELYGRAIDLTRYSFSPRAIARRAQATKTILPKWLNIVRAFSSQGRGRVGAYSEILWRIEHDPEFGPYFHRETTAIPRFYSDRVRRDLGPFWDWLPPGALEHDPNAYLKAHTAAGQPQPLAIVGA